MGDVLFKSWAQGSLPFI